MLFKHQEKSKKKKNKDKHCLIVYILANTIC